MPWIYEWTEVYCEFLTFQ